MITRHYLRSLLTELAPDLPGDADQPRRVSARPKAFGAEQKPQNRTRSRAQFRWPSEQAARPGIPTKPNDERCNGLPAPADRSSYPRNPWTPPDPLFRFGPWDSKSSIRDKRPGEQHRIAVAEIWKAIDKLTAPAGHPINARRISPIRSTPIISRPPRANSRRHQNSVRGSLLDAKTAPHGVRHWR